MYHRQTYKYNNLKENSYLTNRDRIAKWTNPLLMKQMQHSPTLLP
ncbi:protein of unknown function [Bartonella clarridgeiae 73]|uniref:Uncharacterized protein n=1 Tax=Bartonella clarridgeiae (strain CCUG 45776 / CIP 104772 / 73) TaxID=696125 RepID=E6YH52_BARC7|nr:protein of unknown function [Bartonella clarridgeiae 73]